MLDREMSSIIRFTLDNANNPNPYYWQVPEDFSIPAAYFPQPELSSRGDTLNEYALEFVWFIKFFNETDMAAYMSGYSVLNEIKRKRNVIPLIDERGNLTGRGFRLEDPSLRVIDTGSAQLTIRWDSRRPYHEPDTQKMMTYHVNFINSAFESAVMQNGGLIHVGKQANGTKSS